MRFNECFTFYFFKSKKYVSNNISSPIDSVRFIINKNICSLNQRKRERIYNEWLLLWKNKSILLKISQYYINIIISQIIIDFNNENVNIFVYLSRFLN